MSHLFTTNDTDIFSCYLLRRGIWVALIHVPGRIAVADEIHYPSAERTDSDDHIAKDMDRQAVKHEQDGEETQVDRQLEEIGE
jgi:hypothetical protein